MGRNYKYLIGGTVVIIAILILAIVLVVNNSSSPSTSQNYTRPLASYASNPTTTVSMLIDGPETGPVNHNQAIIKVNNQSISITIYRGYNDQVVKQESYSNSIASFHVFLRSLEFANYPLFTNNPNLGQASGVCPTGDRYIFETQINNQITERAWTTSCSGLPQTFLGNFSIVFQQFTAQIPNYLNYTTNYNF